MEVECIIYRAQSLKQKRSVIKSQIAKIRQSFNVSISEIEFQDVWQRTKFAVVMVANEYRYAEKVMQGVLKLIDQDPKMERTITKMERL
jgi:uncharacterized protein YlxP (DUF503 family)